MSKFSVIVPMYNVENYIAECIRSVIAQTYDNWELILVDDGSKDRTCEIAKSYAEKDDRIKVISKAHGGPAQTRNVGIQACSGDYIALLDGDDYWHSEHLEKVNLITDKYSCDMCIMNNHINFTENNYQDMVLFPVDEGSNDMCLEEALDTIFDPRYRLPAATFLPIYKVDFLVKNEIHYEDKYYCSEDLDFFLQCIALTDSIKFGSHKYYYYRQDNQGALTKNISGTMLLDRLCIYKKWFDFFDSKWIGQFDCKKIQNWIAKDTPYNIKYLCGLPYDTYKSKAKNFFIENGYIWCPLPCVTLCFYMFYAWYWQKTLRSKIKKYLLKVIKP